MFNILITGGAGYMGAVVTNLALNYGYKVKVVDLLWFDKKVPLVNLDNPNYTFVKGDIRDVNLTDKILKGVDFVIHAAAIVGEPASKKFPHLTKDINYNASINLISKASEYGVKGFIFLSTCSNYGITQGVATENTAVKPLSLYASTKVSVEKHLLSEVKNMGWVICRMATLYGYSPRMRFDLTVNDFTMNAFIKKYLDIFLPHTYRPYIHVLDAATVILKIIERFNEVKNNVFNVGFNGENYQKIQIAEIIQQFMPDVHIDIVKKGTYLRDYQVDFSKL
jgi:nucleoside-diphosphate-sugar epimerase